MVTRIDPLEILITARNQSRRAFNQLRDDLNSTEGRARLATKAITALSVAGSAAFIKLASDGAEVADQLSRMGSLLGSTTQEADSLFTAIKNANPAADIDKVTEATLTLGEAFFDAKAESGPLFDLIEDFGVNFDPTIQNSREQLAEFLRVLQQIPGDSDRASAAIAVLGGDDAKPFIKIARDAELTTQAISDLETAVGDLDGSLSSAQAEGIDNYRVAIAELGNAYDSLALSVSTLLDGPLAVGASGLSKFFDGMNFLVGGLNNVADFAAGEGGIAFRKFVNFLVDKGLLDAPERKFITKDLSGGSKESIANFGTTLDTETTSASSGGGVDAEKERLESLRQLKEQQREEERLDREEEEQLQEEFQRYQEEQRQIQEETMSAYARANDAARQAESDRLQQLAEDARNAKIEAMDTANAFVQLGNAVGYFARASVEEGSKAFKIFQGIQMATATASAYSAATQALADFSNSSTIGKVGAAFKVLAIGLGWAGRIAGISSSGGGGSSGSSSAPAPVSSPSLPQAVELETPGQSQQPINITVQGRFLSVEDLQELGERLAEIPGQPFLTVSEAI